MASRIWRPPALYYITRIANLPSILTHGILSHALVQERDWQPNTLYDEDIVAWRQQRPMPGEASLWEYANLYIQPRNPMLYRVIAEQGVEQVAVLEVSPEVMRLPGALFTTGNAARRESQILPMTKWNEHATEIRHLTEREWWSEIDGSKRGIMAEVLVPRFVPPQYIKAIHVANNAIRERVLQALQGKESKEVPVIPSPPMFFLPQSTEQLTPLLRLVKGDMFFSRRQTLTISVNTVCVMGKGLASRVRYQFPDAYVAYQDACKHKKLAPGLPYLYKRELPLEILLADEIPYRDANQITWFLFFPTKRHWRNKARLDDIEAGLQWLVQHYKRLGIRSLALPALGCGLGGLPWAQVGPLMVRYLRQLDIEVDIHLPLEQSVPQAQRSKEFLLPPSRLL